MIKLNGLIGSQYLKAFSSVCSSCFKVDLILALHKMCVSIKARRFYSCSREISERDGIKLNAWKQTQIWQWENTDVQVKCKISGDVPPSPTK